jgi:hypothetical protein
MRFASLTLDLSGPNAARQRGIQFVKACLVDEFDCAVNVALLVQCTLAVARHQQLTE